MHSAPVHVHMYMHTYMYALCDYSRRLRTCSYAAILVNRSSDIFQAGLSLSLFLSVRRSDDGAEHL